VQWASRQDNETSTSPASQGLEAAAEEDFLAGWAAGSCVWVEAAAFREVGGFGTEYYAGEEVFLSRRLKSLARRTSRRFVILSGSPLHTSSRKLKLYTVTEAARFFFRMLFSAGRAAKRPEECDIWYDGRR
jgi:GT2 family glycosyltransferase